MSSDSLSGRSDGAASQDRSISADRTPRVVPPALANVAASGDVLAAETDILPRAGVPLTPPVDALAGGGRPSAREETPVAAALTAPRASTQRLICKTCDKEWEAGLSRCPDDGSRLIVPANASDRIGEVIGDRLTVTGILGRGGMGVVYRAIQAPLGREVAVKVLNRGFAEESDAVRRFLREARSASRLSHPNIVTVFDFGQTDQGELYLVMELMRGHELFAELQNVGPFPVERAVHIVTQICDALHHAHEQDVVHRDLKPENVYLIKGGFQQRDFVKVLDFGLAKERPVAGVERITGTDMVCGTPSYISPEQVLGESVDRRADIYSLGVVLFELLTGRTPFPDAQPVKQLMAHATTPAPRLRDVAPWLSIPTALEDVVDACLQKNPDSRPQTTMELAQRLVAALQGEASSDDEVVLAEPVNRPSPAFVLPSAETLTGMPSLPTSSAPSNLVGRATSVATPRPAVSPLVTSPAPVVTPRAGNGRRSAWFGVAAVVLGAGVWGTIEWTRSSEGPRDSVSGTAPPQLAPQASPIEKTGETAPPQPAPTVAPVAAPAAAVPAAAVPVVVPPVETEATPIEARSVEPEEDRHRRRELALYTAEPAASEEKRPAPRRPGDRPPGTEKVKGHPTPPIDPATGRPKGAGVID